MMRIGGTAELAKETGLKLHQVRYLAKQGRIPCTRLRDTNRGHFLFDLDVAIKAIKKELGSHEPLSEGMERLGSGEREPSGGLLESEVPRTVVGGRYA